MNANNSRHWFGPKRIGRGYRPQTWQGWLITVLIMVLIAAAVITTAIALGH